MIDPFPLNSKKLFLPIVYKYFANVLQSCQMKKSLLCIVQSYLSFIVIYFYIMEYDGLQYLAFGLADYWIYLNLSG